MIEENKNNNGIKGRMKILIAEDDRITCRIIENVLIEQGYEVVVTRDGNEAWKILKCEDAPQLVILDWMMPGMDGVDICKKLQAKETGRYIYIILLTAKIRKDDIAAGLDAGADNYVTKPFDEKELRARVRVGFRILELQNNLAEHVAKLEEALSNVRQLQGLLPMCAYCKKIRVDQNYWQQVEKYISAHSEAKISHSICPSCYEEFVKPDIDEVLTNDKTIGN